MRRRSSAALPNTEAAHPPSLRYGATRQRRPTEWTPRRGVPLIWGERQFAATWECRPAWEGLFVAADFEAVKVFGHELCDVLEAPGVFRAEGDECLMGFEAGAGQFHGAGGIAL